MHILVIPSEIYCTEFQPLGGIFQNDQAKALLKEGLTIGIISVGYLPSNQIFRFNKFKKPINSREDGINIIRSYSKKFFPFRFISTTRKYRFFTRKGLSVFTKYIDKYGTPDLIHAHNCFYAGVIACCISKKYQIPFVITEHSSQFFTKLKKKEKEILHEVHLSCRNHIAVSNTFCKIIQELVSPSLKEIQCVPNIVNNIFENSSLKFKEKGNEFIFLNIGGLDKIKNQRLLIEAFVKKFYLNRDIKLKIIGDGAERMILKNIVNRYGVNEQVEFLGYLNRNDVLKEIQNCNAFVLSSDFETFGVVLIEAAACGKPLISTSCVGPNDIINATNGLLVPVGDVEKLGDGMKQIFENYEQYDPFKIKEECILKYGSRAIVNQLLEIYNQSLLQK